MHENILYALFHLKNKVLMKLRGFLCFKSLASTADQDIDQLVLLRITKRETLNNPTGLMPNLIPLADLDEVTNTMNETDHSQLNNIEQYWPTRISSYAILCDSVNDPLTTMEIRTTSTQIYAFQQDYLIFVYFPFLVRTYSRVWYFLDNVRNSAPLFG